MFSKPQIQVSQWSTTLLPVVLVPMRSLGDAPGCSLEELAQRLEKHVLIDEDASSTDASPNVPDVSTPSCDECETGVEQATPESESSPLFAMMGRNDASSDLKIKMNRKTTIVERKSVMQ